MLEVLFAHQSQEQAFLALLVCGLVLGLMLHAGAALRHSHILLGSLWDCLTALVCTLMLFGIMLHYHTGLRAYCVLGILLGLLLYLAGLAQPLQAIGRFFQKYKNLLRPKAGKSISDDE